MDGGIIRLALALLGAVCCLCIIGITVAEVVGKEPPAILGAIGSTCAGAIVGILVQPRQPPGGH